MGKKIGKVKKNLFILIFWSNLSKKLLTLQLHGTINKKSVKKNQDEVSVQKIVLNNHLFEQLKIFIFFNVNFVTINI